MELGRLKKKARFQLSNNGSNLALLFLMTVAFYALLFFMLGRFSLEAVLIINGPVVLGFTIYFLAISRVEKKPRTKKEKEDKDKEKKQKGKFSIFGAEITIGKKIKINLDTAEHPYRVSMKYVFYGFKYFLNAAALYIWTTLLILVWSVLLIVPGVIKALDLSMSFFILADNPTMDVRQATNLSARMMKGYRKKFFLLNLSFIGWILISIFTFSIGFAITIPYMMTTYALFYDELKNESIRNGIIAEDEIGTKRLWEY
ncbi:DUF975 family protein [Acetivibrio mesophilus]|uniref:DUF975 family protein n=1 Tax=Acetivibrio mesophilus TaxID=2487273 RepID=A0A4Q0I5G0_9FIRM|nr:DUF975 family protein [Acetivibrio mesophilus]ODM25951.1 hypothetical protein A7W90_06765 [Clostridium sp. Bc-iso-3]RXE58212.1 DUF975 family protein [Acetivibrio mesophilus]HHV29269.1 DUF975 family protein [Clostridium sp.]